MGMKRNVLAGATGYIGQFFLTVTAMDMVAPEYGSRTLKQFFPELRELHGVGGEANARSSPGRCGADEKPQ